MDMKASATNFRTVVTIWTEPMFFTPDMLITAGTHRPTSTSKTVISLLWLLLMNTSTYSTQPTAIPALPAHALIQYDHALKKPSRLPNATRAYAYGPPSAGSRRASAANIRASTMAPIVVSPIETRVIGPIEASDVGRLKIPTPMMLPMISAIATGSPKPPPGAAAAPAARSSAESAVVPAAPAAPAAPAPSPVGAGGMAPACVIASPCGSRGASVIAHHFSLGDGKNIHHFHKTEMRQMRHITAGRDLTTGKSRTYNVTEIEVK